MINLFFNYYESPTRQHEIDYCLEQNKKVFDNVIILEGRPTFKGLFKLTDLYPSDVNCFCNSDIYFKAETIHLLNTIKENECYALTRYDLKDGKDIFFGRRDSQDAWIFRGVIKPINADFKPGMWGADNRLAYEIKKAGYKISNPSLDIKTIHVHEVDNRDQVRTKENTVPPPYFLLPPSKL